MADDYYCAGGVDSPSKKFSLPIGLVIQATSQTRKADARINPYTTAQGNVRVPRRKNW